MIDAAGSTVRRYRTQFRVRDRIFELHYDCPMATEAGPTVTYDVFERGGCLGTFDFKLNGSGWSENTLFMDAMKRLKIDEPRRPFQFVGGIE
jgi:hypothetical protein